MAITKYDLDINKQAIIKPVVILRQGDYGIDTMQVSLSVANEPMDLTGATVTFMGNTANGRQIIDDAHVKIIDAKGGVFEYVFPSQAASDIGEYKVAYFSITQANGQSSTMDLRVQVLSGVDISAPVASEYIAHYDTMVTELNSAYDSATRETNEKMASTVSSLATSAATVLDSALARVNDINSTANSASSAASKAVSMASSVASAVTSQATYINSVASSAATDVNRALDKINNLSIGGRNLYLNSKKLPDSYNPNDSVTVTTEPFDSTTNMWHIVAPQGSGGGVGIYIFNYGMGKIPNNSNWSYSADIKGTGKLAVFGIENGNGNGIKGTVGSEWSRISQTGYVYTPVYKTLVMYFDTTDSPLDVYIKLPKLEIGNVATDWTPAPEDMASATGRGKILDGADLNNYTEPYKYVIEGATNIANYPSGANVWAILEVDKINSATFTQKITDTDNRVFLRTYAGARPVWSAWIQLSNDGNVLHKTGNETAAGDKTFTGKVAVSGTLDAVQKVYSRTIGSTNDLLINYTRVGNLVTGRYNVKFGGTFPLGANDGFKAPSAYPVNVISYNANAWFMPDNTFHADTGSTGNFMFITNDPLPSN